MLAALQALRGEHEFSVEVMDVDANPDWVVRYDQLVPVLVLGNEEICHYFLNTAKVREVLSRFR
jgi:thioredoxin reductase (NADPH)